jgi:hypothetical protein
VTISAGLKRIQGGRIFQAQPLVWSVLRGAHTLFGPVVGYGKNCQRIGASLLAITTGCKVEQDDSSSWHCHAALRMPKGEVLLPHFSDSVQGNFYSLHFFLSAHSGKRTLCCAQMGELMGNRLNMDNFFNTILWFVRRMMSGKHPTFVINSVQCEKGEQGVGEDRRA